MDHRKIAILPRLSIGEAAKQYGLTLRAIRLYDELGLIDAHRDGRNFRYFDATGCRKLEWIALLRSAGLAIPDIADVLVAERSGGAVACAIDKLGSRRRSVQIDLAMVDLALLKLNAPARERRAG